MKAISAVIAVILILMITVALSAAAYLFFSKTMSAGTEAGTQQTETFLKKGQANFEIDELTISEIYVRNTGQIPLTKFKLYVDRNDVAFTVDKDPLEVSQVATITPSAVLKVGNIIKVTTAEGIIIEKTLIAPDTAKKLGPAFGGGYSGSGVGGDYPITGPLEPPVCGDGEVSSGEDCENDIGVVCTPEYGIDKTCTYCDTDCKWKTITTSTYCGDGIINGPEQCEGDNLDGATCQSIGFGGGTLSCSPSTCLFDNSSCYPLGTMFATSTKYYGNAVGGITGADAKCQARATAASLPGTWIALISSSASNIKDRLPDIIYTRMDGILIAENKADLFDGYLNGPLLDPYPINIDESGAILPITEYAWTGSDIHGIATSNTCSNWVGSGYGTRGMANAIDNLWIYTVGTGSYNNCATNTFHLYCVRIA